MSANPHRQAYAYCAFCPKVCRFSCPVSEATANESTSTWGKMSVAHLTTTGARPLDPDGAKALHACTGCMRCKDYCKHENEVGFALFAAREQSLSAEVAPPGMARTVRSFREHGTPFERPLTPEVDAQAPHAFFPGCSSLTKAPEVVEDARVVSEKLGRPLGVRAVGARCCGYPLYAAGLHAELREHAQGLVRSLGSDEELVVMDPGCAYTFQVVYPRLGVQGPKVKTLTRFLAEALPKAEGTPPLDLEVSYHDACHLGRGLGEFDPPRELLRAAVRHVREPFETRKDAGCSGGGGLLPRSLPEVSVQVAAREADRAGPPGVAVATACPTSRRMFERAGRESFHLVTLLRRWLGGRERA